MECFTRETSHDRVVEENLVMDQLPIIPNPAPATNQITSLQRPLVTFHDLRVLRPMVVPIPSMAPTEQSGIYRQPQAPP